MRGAMPKFCSGLVAGLILVFIAVAGPPAQAGWVTSVDRLGDGSVKVELWAYPNAPPAAPNAFASSVGGSPSISIPPPPVPGADPLTQVSAQVGAL